MARGSIYTIINKENGHRYINYTLLALNKEWQNHIESSKRMSHELIHRAFRQFGVDKFRIIQLDECEERFLEERRLHWMYQYYPEYNDKLPKKQEPEVIPVPKPVREKKTTWREIKPEERGSGKYSSIRIMGILVETGETKEWENSRMAAIEITGDVRKSSPCFKICKPCLRAERHNDNKQKSADQNDDWCHFENTSICTVWHNVFFLQPFADFSEKLHRPVWASLHWSETTLHK